MTSEERHELRYQRRKQKRAAAKSRLSHCDSFDEVFSYKNLYGAYRKCRRGVAWKSSVQKYITQAPLVVFQTYQKLQNGTYRSGGFAEFDIFERGKQRHIRSVTMEERVVQRCLCDNALVPMLSRTFIHDNGAAMVDKGYHFSVRRLCQHLHEHYRQHGTEGYVLLFDFSKFFDRVSHELCKATLNREFDDERIKNLAGHFIDAFGEVGLGLGSQVSQILALSSANRLDHFIKENLRIRGYGRYMDDGYLIHRSKDYLRECLKSIKTICDRLGIVLNQKKTQIVKLSRGFSWLKVRFILTRNGRVIRKMNREGITKMRKKLKSFENLMKKDNMSAKDVIASWQSWEAYARHFHAYKTRKEMGQLCTKLFAGHIL